MWYFAAAALILSVPAIAWLHRYSSSKPTRWAKEVDVSTLMDSWWTYCALHLKGELVDKKEICSFQEFCSSVRAAEYSEVPLAGLLASAHNVGKHRLAADSVEAAYPPEDRPRGEYDIESVKSLMNCSDSITPVLVLKDGDRWVFLDGTHRLLAAKLLGGPEASIRVCWVGM